ncbi:TPA: PAS domain S-box protein [Candidatus Poribacteria bacterium]|nr:PAS domain S-box protein [Candidatus Poribacteria bacterium]
MSRFEQLQSVLDEILRTFDLDKLLRSIVENLQKLGFDRAGVFLIDEDRQVAQGTWGVDEDGKLERISEQEFPADLLTSREGYYVVGEEVLKEKLSIDASELFLEIGEEEKFRQLFGYMPPCPGYYKRVELGDNFSFPIVVENKTIGSIAVDDHISHRHINEEDAQLLSMFVSLAGIAIQNADQHTKRMQAEEEIRRRNRELREINELGFKLNQQTSIDDVIKTLWEGSWSNEILGYNFCSIGLVEGDYLSFKTGTLEDSEYKLVEGFRIKIGEGPTGHAVAIRKTIVCQDVTREPRHISVPIGADETLAELVVPLKSGERVIGVLDIHRNEKNCFSEDDVALAETLARHIAAALGRAEVFEKLRDSEEMYRALVQASPDAIIMSDLTGKIVQANPRAAELAKVEGESELIGLNSFDFIAQKDQDRARENLEKTLRDGFVRDVEYTCIRTDGTQFPAELSASLIRNTAGEPVAFVGIIKDITERKEFEEQLLQKQKLEAVGELAGGIAHDFNNILTGITGYASLMMMQMEESHPFYNAVKTIQDAGNRAAELTQQLLGFARGGKYLVQPVNLNDSVENVLQLTKETFDRAIDIETNLDENLSFTEGDSGQLEQVLLNLCLNARDAMPAGGKLTIETSNVTLDENYARIHLDIEAGKYVLVQVTDTGMGMSSEVKQRIFEPFFSTKEVGTGMGLAMVYGIVKNHNGVINVYSEIGKGSTFKIYLPALEKEIAEEGAKIEEESPRGSESILLVDDEEHVRNVGKAILESLGYRVYLANSGIEACKIYGEKRDEIELVLLDIVMPEISGKETYRRLRKIASDVRVVLVSGYSINDGVREILNEGAMDFLQKPFDVKEFASIIRKALDSS